MTERRCDQCGGKFRSRQHNQRFCCREHSDAWHNEERRRGVELLRTRREWNGEDLVESIKAGDPEAVDTAWRLTRRALVIIGERIERGELRLSQLFCFVRDIDELEQRNGSYAEWIEGWRARNPKSAAEIDDLRKRFFGKLQAKARDGTLVQWCQRNGLNPAAVADFVWGGTGRPPQGN